MKILCCGDRNWFDWDTIRRTLEKMPKNTHVVHGAARGADTLAGIVAQELGFTVTALPAEWEKYGKAAGVLRNQSMLDLNPDIELVLAFHDNIAESKGTRDMVRRANKAGIETRIIQSKMAQCAKAS